MEFLKTTAGKIISGLVALAVVAGGISWWTMEPATRQMLVSGTGKIVSWFGLVLVLPWATFFLSTKAAKLNTNLSAALLVAAYTLVEFLLLLWLFDWSVAGATAWTFVIFGTLVAAVYNLFTCDWIAEKLG